MVGMEKTEDQAERAVPGAFDVMMWCRGEGGCWFRKTLRQAVQQLQTWQLRDTNSLAKYAELGAAAQLLRIGVPVDWNVVDQTNALRIPYVNPKYTEARGRTHIRSGGWGCPC